MRRLFLCWYILQYPVQARAGLRDYTDFIRLGICCFKTIRELTNLWVSRKVASQVKSELNWSVDSERLPCTNCINRYTKVGVARLNYYRFDVFLATLHMIPYSTNKTETVIHMNKQYLRLREKNIIKKNITDIEWEVINWVGSGYRQMSDS
jgi:hypothetical protein